MILYSICIATYKRPELLRKLINSLLAQKNIDLLVVEIIIVDNDSEFSARSIIKEYDGNVNCSIQYHVQPEKNIYLTRNVAVSKAIGDYIFFIDDDEYADEQWMSNHIKNLIKFKADGAFGKVVSYFPAGIPEWIRNCYVYHRNTNPSGQPPANLNTGNCFIRSSFFKIKNYQFDPEFGLTGGGDHQLFSQIQNDGAKFISCDDAVTFEYVPESRASVKWLIRRVARTGNNFSRTKIEQSKGFNKLGVRIKEFFKGIIQSLLALIVSILMIWKPAKSLNWFLKSVSNISKPLAVLGIYPEEYKK